MSSEPPDPPILNPVSGTTIDTSPRNLGLNGEQQSESVVHILTESRESASPSKGIVKRTVEQTAAKLGSGFTGGRKSSASSGRRPSGTKRLFGSLSRKGKGKEVEKGGEGDIGSGDADGE